MSRFKRRNHLLRLLKILAIMHDTLKITGGWRNHLSVIRRMFSISPTGGNSSRFAS